MSPSQTNRAFTLIEMATSLAIISILLVAMGSAIVLASRAVPDRNTPANLIVKATSVQDQIAAELMYATSVTESTPTSVTFTIPDRTGDSLDETIRYSWSGVAGDPLYRSVNGAAAHTVLGSVHEFQLLYDRRRLDLPQTYSQSSETLLFSYDTSNNLSDFEVESQNWPGQYFKPTLPANAAWWRITRLSLKARVHGPPDGESRVQIRDADAFKAPGMIVYDQAVLLESSLTSSFQWKEFLFTRNAMLPAGNGVCIVIQWVTDADACDIQYRSFGGNSTFVKTSNSGSSWAVQLGQTMLMQVYGTVATADAAAYQYRLNNVRMTLRCGGDLASRVCATIAAENLPEVPAP